MESKTFAGYLEGNNVPRYYMHTNTGSVDTAENWVAESGPACLEGPDMIEVVLASGQPVPEGFDPSQSDQYTWVEVE